jgi:hypothetical protein
MIIVNARFERTFIVEGAAQHEEREVQGIVLWTTWGNEGQLRLRILKKFVPEGPGWKLGVISLISEHSDNAKTYKDKGKVERVDTQLLCCPFCGHQPNVLPRKDAVDSWKSGSCVGVVECLNSDCPAHPTVFDGEDINDERGSAGYIMSAILRWNTRF